MLTKIAAQTIKTKWKDLLILFAGLIISIAIFYMFSTVANNKAFLTANTSIKAIVVIFIVGEILLGLITFIYLNFANRFLVQLRQREYGLLMMFGANKANISRLLFMETFFLGVISLIIGTIVGAGLTGFAGQFLQQMLGLTLAHWQMFNITGFLVTVVYFVIVFSLNGIINQIYISRSNINTLLRAEQTAEKMPKPGFFNIIVGIIGILLLILSFIVMQHILKISILLGLILALSLNVSGTFLTIRSGLALVLNLIKQSKFSAVGLRNFTLGQLTFRLKAFERILTVVTLLFALALGALTVGRSFQMSLPIIAQQSSPFTISIIQPTVQEKQLISQLKGVEFVKSYQYKLTNKALIWSGKQFNQEPLPFYHVKNSTNFSTAIPKVHFADEQMLQSKQQTNFEANAILSDLANGINTNNPNQSIIVNEQQFKKSTTVAQQIIIVRVKNMESNHNANVLAKLQAGQLKRFSGLKERGVSGTFGFLTLAKGFSGGLEFMGFFLAIAFLVMLASTLMFKVLTNANVDRRRYNILMMIGATPIERLRANATEIGIVFAIPLIIGIIDVVYGLKFFKNIMADPYLGFQSSLLLIGSLYIVYYILTVFIYQRILKKH